MLAYRSTESCNEIKDQEKKCWADIRDESEAEDSEAQAKFGDSEDDTSASDHGLQNKEIIAPATMRRGNFKNRKSWASKAAMPEQEEWKSAGKKAATAKPSSVAANETWSYDQWEDEGTEQ